MRKSIMTEEILCLTTRDQKFIQFYLFSQNKIWRRKKDFLLSIHRDLPYTPNQLSYRNKMTEDRIQTPSLDKNGIDGKRIYNYRQWSERFEQYTKKRYDTDIGALIKEKTMTGTEWDTKEEKT